MGTNLSIYLSVGAQGQIIDNMILESQVLTSGYTSYQEVNKPLGMIFICSYTIYEGCLPKFTH